MIDVLVNKLVFLMWVGQSSLKARGTVNFINVISLFFHVIKLLNQYARVVI